MEQDQLNDQSEEKIYPPKPQLNREARNPWKNLISLLPFLLLFGMIYKWDIELLSMITGIILIHELGHAIAMKIFHYHDVSILFIPLLGGAATGEKLEPSQKEECIVLLSGPLPGIILGTLLWIFPIEFEWMNTNKLAIYLVVINVFNLLPILPLDGGRLLKNLYFEKNDTITRIFLFLSLGALVYYSIYTASYTLLILPFFLVLQLINHFQSLKLKQQLSACDVHIEQTFEQLSDKDYWIIRDEMGSRIAHFKNIITPGNHEVSEREEVVINYMRNLLRKPQREDLNPFGLLGFTIVWLAFIALPIVLYIIRTSN